MGSDLPSEGSKQQSVWEASNEWSVNAGVGCGIAAETEVTKSETRAKRMTTERSCESCPWILQSCDRMSQ